MKTNTSIFSFEGRIKEIRLQQKKAESNLEKQTHHDRREGGTNDSGIAESFNSFSLISTISYIHTTTHNLSLHSKTILVLLEAFHIDPSYIQHPFLQERYQKQPVFYPNMLHLPK